MPTGCDPELKSAIGFLRTVAPSAYAPFAAGGWQKVSNLSVISMLDFVELTRDELDAYGRLAEAMYEFTYANRKEEPIILQRGGKDFRLSGEYYIHAHASHEELYAKLLSRLGLISPVTDEPIECAFRYNMSPQEAYEFAVSRVQHGPSLNELLAAFLYCQSDYGGGFRVYPRDSFPVSMELHELFLSLANAGFVLRKGLEFQWTEKAAPSMVQSHLWPLGDEEYDHRNRTGRR